MKLYHSTQPSNVKAIIQNGLIIAKSSDGCIYFGEDEYTAAVFQWLDHCSYFSIIEFEIPIRRFCIKRSFDHNEKVLKEWFPEIPM